MPVILEEQIDLRKLYNIVKYSHKYPLVDTETLRHLKRYFNSFKKSRTIKETKYRQAININNKLIGRLFADKSLSLQNICREIRHTISKDFYVDIDMNGAQLAIIKFICQKNNIECDFISSLLSEREEILKELINYYSLENRCEAKKIIISITNGGSFPRGRNPPKILKDFKLEILRIFEEIKGLDKELYDFCLTERRENPMGSYISLLTQDLENKIILEVKKVLEEKGLKVGVLVFDGCMVYKNDKMNINEVLLQEIERRVFDIFGAEIGFSFKEMNEDFEVFDNDEIPNNFKFDYYAEDINEIRRYEEFESNQNINSRYIDKNINYASLLENYDTLFICSNMGTGKTFGLTQLFENYKRVLVITYRRSLNYNFCEKFGLKSYDEIKTSYINCERLSCQIDSLWRVSNDYDLIVLDEVSYMLEHLYTFVKDRRLVEDNLKRILGNQKSKVVVLDALLKKRHIQLIESLRIKNSSSYIIKNRAKVYEDYSCEYIEGNKKDFINLVLQKILINKKLIVPSNSKKAILELKYVIKEKFNNKLKVLYIDGETDDELVNVDLWSEFDVVLYSPRIEAGLSFDEEHFDEEICYVCDKSNSPRSFCQMMFRNRKLKDKRITMIGKLINNVYKPITEDDILNEIKSIKTPFKDLGFKVEDLSLTTSDYRDRYLKIIRGMNIESLSYKESLREFLEQHGIVWIEKENKEIEEVINKEEVVVAIEKGEDEKAEEIINSKSLSCDEFEKLKEKIRLSEEERNSMKKFVFKSVFEIENDKLLNTLMFRDLYNYLKQAKTQNILRKEGKEYYLEKAKEVSSNAKKSPDVDVYLKMKDEGLRVLKIVYLINFLEGLGYYNRGVFKEFNYRVAWNYIVKNKNSLKVLFGRCALNWDLDCESEKGKTAIMRFISPKLKSVLGYEFRRDNKKKNDEKQLISLVDELKNKHFKSKRLLRREKK